MEPEPAGTFVLSLPVNAWTPALPTTVASLLAQSTPLKVAVLDASADPRVAEALTPLTDLTVYRREGPDTGQAAAIQEGWDAVEGDYYGWLNADDFLFPSALERVRHAFRSQPETDVVTGQSILVSPEMDHLGVHPSVASPSTDLYRTNTIAQPSTFMTRRALDKVGKLNTKLHYTMDWDVWVRLMANGASFHFTDEVLSGAVVVPDAKTSQFNAARASEIFHLVRRMSGIQTAVKSVIGTWQYHWASGAGRAAAPVSLTKDCWFRAGVSFTEPVQADVVSYEHPIVSLQFVGSGAIDVSLKGKILSAIEPGEAIAVQIPAGYHSKLELSPTGGTACFSRIIVR